MVTNYAGIGRGYYTEQDPETDIQAGIAAGVSVNFLYYPLGSGRPTLSATNAVIESFMDVMTILHHEIDRTIL